MLGGDTRSFDYTPHLDPTHAESLVSAPGHQLVDAGFHLACSQGIEFGGVSVHSTFLRKMETRSLRIV